MKSLQEVLCNVSQVFDGWHNDGTAWSEWDESVRRDVSEWARHIDGKIVAVNAPSVEELEEAARQVIRKYDKGVCSGIEIEASRAALGRKL